MQSQAKQVVTGANQFSVRVCPGEDTVRYITGSARPARFYAASVSQSGPTTVEVVFTPDPNHPGATYDCAVSVVDGILTKDSGC